MTYNIDTEISIKTKDDTTLERLDDFKYLGAWIDNTEKDIKIRKALAWQACNKLTKIWKSTLPGKIKIKLLSATVESVLLYGSETWTLTNKLEKQLDGCYTRMLRAAVNVHWSQHMTNEELYGGLPKISHKIQVRRLKLAGHCCRHKEELAAKLVLWTPTHGQTCRGRPRSLLLSC